MCSVDTDDYCKSTAVNINRSMLILRSAETHDKGINSEEEKDTVISEILFLAFEGDTLWVYFFKLEASAHILTFFVLNASPSNPHSRLTFPQE